jgi:8-oxo-dGTP pyrophosphatase MutT (NUDIX family)
LITSTNRGHWGFPKGIIEGDDTPRDTALAEAHEEAGLRGRIVGEPIGEYRYQKWGTDLDVTVFLMEVETADDDWLESGVRQREWVAAMEAMDRIAWNEKVATMFSVALSRFSPEQE